MELFEILMIFAGIALCIWFFIYFWLRLPIKMARRRGRDPLGWVLIFWLLSPIWGILILWLAGDRHE
jgi:hypothetical protein